MAQWEAATASVATVRSRAGSGSAVRLIDGFEARMGPRVLTLPRSAQRVLAFLALHERPLHRIFVAGTLWPDLDDSGAAATLRSGLWRLRRAAAPLVRATTTHLQLESAVRVDIREARALARSLLGDRRAVPDAAASAPPPAFFGDLLPDWYDDWVLSERDHFHQLRLHALEALCERLAAAGRSWEAVEAGLAAVAADPLRESAHRTLISAYLAEGNRADAIRQYWRYERALRDELGLEPSPRLWELVRSSAQPSKAS